MRRVHARLKDSTDLLLLHPNVGTRTDDPTIRRMTASPYPYLIFYEVADAEVIIHPSVTRRAIPPGCLGRMIGCDGKAIQSLNLSAPPKRPPVSVFALVAQAVVD